MTSVTSAWQLIILIYTYIYIYIYSAQKLGNFLQHCTDTQTLINYFHKTSTRGRRIHCSTFIQHAVSSHTYSTLCLVHVRNVPISSHMYSPLHLVHVRNVPLSSHMYSALHFVHVRNVPLSSHMYFTPHATWCHQVAQPSLSSARNCWTVSSISLQLADSLPNTQTNI